MSAFTASFGGLRVTEARSLRERTLGLIGRCAIDPDEAMLFDRCSSIHTWFMRVPIDVVFLDAAGRVIRALSHVRPWRPLVACAGASAVLELCAGEAARRGIVPGDAFVKTS